MSLTTQLESLRKELAQQAERKRADWLELPSERQPSAENLLHYLALRSHDLRPLQDQLARLGLSSLGRAEAHVMASIDAVLHNLYRLNGEQLTAADETDAHDAFDAGAALLDRNTIRLLGDHPPEVGEPTSW